MQAGDGSWQLGHLSIMNGVRENGGVPEKDDVLRRKIIWIRNGSQGARLRCS